MDWLKFGPLPQPQMKKEHVIRSPIDLSVTDFMGNICINPEAKTGKMYVRPSIVKALSHG